MKNSNFGRALRLASRLVLTVCVGISLLAAKNASAAASHVDWSAHTIKETDKEWKINLTIFMGKTPDMALLPVRFSFTPVVYYERALVDGHDGPVVRKIPLQDKQALVESVDLGFLDPSSGKIEPRTRFTFSISRDHGFTAGEYDVVLRDGRTDQLIGAKTHIVLEGDNDVVDRRAMDFSNNDKKQETQSKPADKKEKEYATSAYSPDDPAYWEGGPTEPEKKEEPLPPPASMKQRPCGCRLVGDAESASGAPLVLTLVGVVGLFLERRRAGS